jgi:hypothetical protein
MLDDDTGDALRQDPDHSLPAITIALEIYQRCAGQVKAHYSALAAGITSASAVASISSTTSDSCMLRRPVAKVKVKVVYVGPSATPSEITKRVCAAVKHKQNTKADDDKAVKPSGTLRQVQVSQCATRHLECVLVSTCARACARACARSCGFSSPFDV